MNTLFLPLRVCFALVLFAQVLLAAPVLQVKREGRPVPVTELKDWKPGIDAEEYYLNGEFAEILALGVPWKDYSLWQLDVDDSARGKEGYGRAFISIHAKEYVDPAGATQFAPLSAFWQDPVSPESLFFVAWISAGKILRCDRLQAVEWQQKVSAAFVMKGLLSPEEMRCSPVLLHWVDGQFVAPEAKGWKPGLLEAMRCAVSDDAAGLSRCLGSGLSVSARDPDDFSLADMAASSDAVNVLAVLRDAKADLKENRALKTPIERAASLGRTQAVAFLLGAKVSPGGRDQENDSPLFCAATQGHAEVVRQLISAKVNVEEQTHNNTTALIGALDHGQVQVAELLLKTRASVNFLSEDNMRAFLSLCREGRTGMVEFFIAHGVSGATRVEGRLALVEAAYRGRPSLAEALLKAGAKVNASDSQDNTPLFMACASGNEAFAKVLLAAGADVALLRKDGASALHAAVLREKQELVKALLAKGAPLEARNQAGLTALDYAVVIGSWDCVSVLVQAGAKLDLKSRFFTEQLDSLLRGDQATLLAQLLASGLSPNHQGTGGWPIRRLAAMVKAKQCEQVLADAGAVLEETLPTPMARAAELDPGFKFLEGQKPADPRPTSREMPAATVKLRVLVGADGRVCFVNILECANHMLCLGLTETVKNWRFTPPRSHGKEVAIWVNQTVDYPSGLEREKAKPVVDELPQLVSTVKPVYPESMLRVGGMAEVIVVFIVNEKGVVEDARISKSSGQAFNQPALDSVRRWKFTPAKAKGVPVRYEMSVPIVFSIAN